jgi:cell wall-associated NlpC family hydrolase
VSEQVTRRHRATQRPVTPLSSLTTAVTGHVGTLSRGGVVIAMSSGLVATLGLPAKALSDTDLDRSTTATLSLAAVKAYEPPSRTTEPVTIAAPKDADVDFEPGATVKAKPVVKRERVRTVSRSTARSEVPAEIKVGNGSSPRGSAILAIAARYLGVPYVYGGTTPSGFDCSGYTGYVFAQLGYHLPRTASQQMYATKRISSANAQAGDLVFFLSGGGASHVGIYAGNGEIYDAGRSGQVVQKRAIWTSAIAFGRVVS